MKLNSTFFDLIKHELINLGYNEMVSNNGNRITFFDRDSSFISLVLDENEEVMKIISKNILYTDYTDENKTFINQFILFNLNRQLKFQTLELFASQFKAKYKAIAPTLSKLYSQELVNNESKTTSKTISNGSNRSHSTYNDLPQDNLNYNLDTDNYDYASNQTLTKSKNDNESDYTTSTNKFDITNYSNYYKFINDIVADFTYSLFSNIMI